MLALRENDVIAHSIRAQFHSLENRNPIDLAWRIAKRELESSPYAELRKLECVVRNGEVIISGRVPTYYLKQLAQVTVKRCNLDQFIDNQVEVESIAAPSSARWTH